MIVLCLHFWTTNPISSSLLLNCSADINFLLLTAAINVSACRIQHLRAKKYMILLFHLHNIFKVTELSTGSVMLLFAAKHLILLRVCLRVSLRIVSPFFTVPSKVCWKVSSTNWSSMYHNTRGSGSPARYKIILVCFHHSGMSFLHRKKRIF